MTHEILIAGFGGQGILSLGMTLTYAGMIEGKEVSWMPSYGPEMRGGTANCIVIISDNKVSSPILTRFDMVVAMNQPSLEKFESSVKPGGYLLYDSTKIVTPPARADVTTLPVPAGDEAIALGNPRVANMVVLGAILDILEVVPVASVLKALKQVLPERYHAMLPLNEEALRRGTKFSRTPCEAGDSPM
ncbi:MAG: 2-oxoacid:acceptor oxidoreductase family protein [Ignavibacteria bacterium]|nr:2-oxoacid:acceptor oxidoreductase family protein [Ignavibacteria bacterium]